MGLFDIFLISIGLSADAFAVAVSIGLCMRGFKDKIKGTLVVAAYFGVFQAGMPVVGYTTASLFYTQVSDYGDIIAFAVLAVIGCKMIWESFKKDKEVCEIDTKLSLTPAYMIPFAFVTSIDALVVGSSFAFLEGVVILHAAAFIGVSTFVLSAIGFGFGNMLGAKMQGYANLIGGVVLILIGVGIIIK